MRFRQAAVIGAAWAALGATAQAGAPKVGQPAPDFSATTFGGREIKLSDFKGEVLVVNFWATWCGPCRQELPLLETAFRAYAPYGFQVIAVASADSANDAALRPVAAKLTIPFIKRLRGPYHDLDAYPTNYVIDRSGKLVYAKAAAFDLDSFNALVVPLLNEPPPADAQAAGAPPAPGTAPAR